MHSTARRRPAVGHAVGRLANLTRMDWFAMPAREDHISENTDASP